MSYTTLVRASRDGDQFHYLWAARRCLRLLLPTSGLVAITIEGASPSEVAAGQQVAAGEEVIDVAEYYGSENFEQATSVKYIQLKHSTLHASEAWTPSGLQNTIEGFASRYKALQQRVNAGTLAGKLELSFVTNRPISASFSEAVEDAAQGYSPRHPSDLTKLQRFTGISGAALSDFCKLLHFGGSEKGYWEQRAILVQDASGYLADSDVDAPTLLKELVNRKALSESASNPTITKMDVLRAFKTDERSLFPAPCRIEQLKHLVPREQEKEIVEEVIKAGNRPIAVHASGGVGKSIFATRVGLGLPKGSLAVLYDCFGNGQYRSVTGYRHRHKDALVQIANELAGRGLCHPLIPTPHAEPSDYMRAFVHRLTQCANSLRSAYPNALLCIVIDAADNAQIAAEEIGESRSFVRDLVREQLPDGVRLVALSRTHRLPSLDLPPSALRLELRSFSREETANHLRRVFPDASEQDVDEFHRLSSQNPRVQSLALAPGRPLPEVLRLLGPNPTTVEQAIGNLLDEAIAKLRDTYSSVEKGQIDRVCAGLAVLRPLIPISVLATMSGVEATAIKSFAYDLGRPLLVDGDTIQFFDEPSETWFRDRFKPKASDLGGFVASLRPLSSTSSYVASALPQLMLEAGNFDELVELALSSEGLPESSPLERRDVELQRLQFALKASLREKRYKEAAKLALKAGGESAGDSRQRKLIQQNTDLGAVFMSVDRIQEMVSRRTFGSGWLGSHHAYEAGLMSGRPELLGDARSRLRMAYEWIGNWSKLSSKERQREEMRDADIAEMAIATFNIHGAAACANDLRRWRPRSVSYRVGLIVADRFVDHARYDDLHKLAKAADNDLCLMLAIIVALQAAHKCPPKEVVERALGLVNNRRVKIDKGRELDRSEGALAAVTALAETCYEQSICDAPTLVSILTLYLPSSPPRGLSSRYDRTRETYFRAYFLRAALSGQSLTLTDLAHPELRTELEKEERSHTSSDAREFKEVVGSLLPWHSLRAAAFVDRVTKETVADEIAKARSNSQMAANLNYREEYVAADEIARLWFEIHIETDTADQSSMGPFTKWIEDLKRPLFTPTLTRLAQSRLRKSAQDDKWSFRLTTGTLCPRIRRDHEQKTTPEPHTGLQG